MSYAVKVPGRGIVLRTHSRARADRRAAETGGKVIRDPRTLVR